MPAGRRSRIAGWLCVPLIVSISFVPLAHAQAEEPRGNVTVYQATVVQVNESALGSLPSSDFQGFSTLGKPTDGYRAIVVHRSRPANPDDSALRYYFEISLVRRDTARAIAAAEAIDPEMNRAENEQIGPTVAIITNGTPPSSREGTIYDSLTQLFAFNGLVTLGVINESNMLFLWCNQTVCEELESNIIAIFVREAETFRPQVAALRLVESELASLDANLQGRLNDEAANENFTSAARLFQKVNTKGNDTPTDLEYATPFQILRVFRASDARQSDELEARKADLRLGISGFKERVGIAQDSQSRAQDRETMIAQTWVLVAAVGISALALFVQAYQTHLQREDFKAARTPSQAPGSQPSNETEPPGHLPDTKT